MKFKAITIFSNGKNVELFCNGVGVAKHVTVDTEKYKGDAARAAQAALMHALEMHPAKKPTQSTEPPKSTPRISQRFYCIKDFGPGTYLTKGGVYSLRTDGTMQVDSGLMWDGFFQVAFYLVPLIERPAKVGEWVYVLYASGSRYEPKKIYRVFETGDDLCVWFAEDGKGNIDLGDYLVLDGYQPEEAKPKQPEYREVKRKAQVGEYIKIVNAMVALDCYQNGESFKVEETNDDGVFFKTAKTRPSITDKVGHSYAWHDEYVVLEGYTPPQGTPEPEKKPFVPHLECDGVAVGDLGKAANSKDVTGKPLFVGDTVEYFCNGVGVEETPVVGAGLSSIGGIPVITIPNGRYKNFVILKKRSFSEVADGEVIRGIKYVKSEGTAK